MSGFLGIGGPDGSCVTLRVRVAAWRTGTHRWLHGCFWLWLWLWLLALALARLETGNGTDDVMI